MIYVTNYRWFNTIVKKYYTDEKKTIYINNKGISINKQTLNDGEYESAI